MKSNLIFLSFMTLLLFSCKKKTEFPKEVKEYHDNNNLKIIYQIDKDRMLNGFFKTFYKSGKLESECIMIDNKIEGKLTRYYEDGKIELISIYANGVNDGKYIAYYNNNNISHSLDYSEGLKHGEEIVYYENGVIKSKAFYVNGRISGDVIVYKENSKFDYYLLFNNNGGMVYKLDVDSLGVVKETTYGKFYIDSIINIKEKVKGILKSSDSLKFILNVANPPSCKKVLHTKLNGVTKDSLEISGIEYNYAVLPTELGNNKFELFLDYYCTDYELKKDYFTLDFDVEE